MISTLSSECQREENVRTNGSHSSGPSTKKVVERREGSEEMKVETHTGARAQKTPSPGTRPAPLSEVAGLRERLEAAARVSVVHPTLAMPSLAGAGGEAVNASTVAFLSRKAVQERMEEEGGEEVGGGAAGDARGGGGPRRLAAGPRQRWCPVLLLAPSQRRAVWTLPAFASKRKRKNKRRRRMRKSRRRFTEEAHFAQLLFMMSQRLSSLR